MIVLSIDPGIDRTGFAFFDKTGSDSCKYLASGLIQTDKKQSLQLRLSIIYDEIRRLIAKYHPRVLVMERVFFAKNQKTAITVGQSQGMLLLLAEQSKLKVHFFTPTEIKLAVTGYGTSDKKSVQKMLHISLNLTQELVQDDQADAIACGYAFCCMNESLMDY
jgi:crossover junction endodeoxyribonuclease RuvC